MTASHFDPAHPASPAMERDERVALGFILLVLLAAWPFALAIACWKRMRGEGWSFTPQPGDW